MFCLAGGVLGTDLLYDGAYQLAFYCNDGLIYVLSTYMHCFVLYLALQGVPFNSVNIIVLICGGHSESFYFILGGEWFASE